jgi:hypothetical protein
MGSSSGNKDALTAPVESAPSETTGTTTTSAPLPPPPLTHREFIRTLDHLCKVGNNLADKKFGSKTPNNPPGDALPKRGSPAAPPQTQPGLAADGSDPPRLPSTTELLRADSCRGFREGTVERDTPPRAVGLRSQ